MSDEPGKAKSQDSGDVQKADCKRKLDFPEKEYEDLYRRARAAITQQGHDELLLTTRKNIRCFSGFKAGMWVTGRE